VTLMIKNRLTVKQSKLFFSMGWLLCVVPVAHAVDAPAVPQVDAKAYILMDYNSGKVLAESNADSRLDPASLTKIMSSYVIGQALKSGKIKTDGLDSEGQYSTARDMALIGQALIRDVPDEYALHKEKEFTFNKIRQINRNRLLWNSSLNVDGMKTGFTSGAGYNLVASAPVESMVRQA